MSRLQHDPDTISIVWTRRDVQAECPGLTIDQARDVLQRLKSRHDANVGVNWRVIQDLGKEVYGPAAVTPPWNGLSQGLALYLRGWEGADLGEVMDELKDQESVDTSQLAELSSLIDKYGDDYRIMFDSAEAAASES